MATHSSILASEIPWMEEPGGLQFMGSQRIGHDLVTIQQPTHISVLQRIKMNMLISLEGDGKFLLFVFSLLLFSFFFL